MKDVVQVNVYLSSIALAGEFNVAYANYFENDAPARAMVGINLMADALVEISVVAYKDKS